MLVLLGCSSSSSFFLFSFFFFSDHVAHLVCAAGVCGECGQWCDHNAVESRSGALGADHRYIMVLWMFDSERVWTVVWPVALGADDRYAWYIMVLWVLLGWGVWGRAGVDSGLSTLQWSSDHIQHGSAYECVCMHICPLWIVFVCICVFVCVNSCICWCHKMMRHCVCVYMCVYIYVDG